MTRTALAFLAAASLFLTGCAGVRTLESEVQTFSSLGAKPAAAAFRFERLPSQASNKHQADVEAMAEQALVKVGLKRDDAKPQYSVQVGVRVQREDRLDWPDAWYYWGMPGPRYMRLSPWSSPWMHTSPWYQREVSLVIRDLGTAQVVYETHGSQEGVWSDTKLILPALFDAALSDFPAASKGARKVATAIPNP